MGEKIMIVVLCIVAGLTYGKIDSNGSNIDQPKKITYYVVTDENRDFPTTPKDFLNREIYETGNVIVTPDKFSEIVYANENECQNSTKNKDVVDKKDTTDVNNENVEETLPRTEETITDQEKSYPEEYEYAVKIWNFLKDNGFNNHVIAGIMGNIMAECGGQSLVLHPEIYGGNFYGICQWNKWYFPEVQGKDLDFQLDYLLDTMKSQFGGHYDGFIKMNSTRDAARSFAQFYERCVSSSYTLRQNNAERAYEYFVNNK